MLSSVVPCLRRAYFAEVATKAESSIAQAGRIDRALSVRNEGRLVLSRAAALPGQRIWFLRAGWADCPQ